VTVGSSRPPGRSEINPACLKVSRGAGRFLSGFRSGVEAATPFPLVDVNRAAGAARNRSDMHIAVIDVPAILAFGITAAGEGGHGFIEARWPSATQIINRWRFGTVAGYSPWQLKEAAN
jgi:hypothetical protein